MTMGNGERGMGKGGPTRRLPFPVPRFPFPLCLLLACTAPPSSAPMVRITIPPGATFRDAADTLLARGIIASPDLFRTLARIRGSDRRLRAGVYDLPQDAGAWQALHLLESGKVATVRFTAPEGLTLLELSALVESRLSIPASDFLAAAGDSSWRREFGITATSLEGYLLPETYTLPLPVTAEALIRGMLTEFDRHWEPGWTARLDSLGLSRIQLLALASIVEGEARHDEERPIIAGVYTNRLRRGMLLQADPTVQYAIQLAKGARKPRLFFRDYAFRSPYNTYVHLGLPPGPVNNPGIKSIVAALYPADVPWLYFVAGPDGYHRFSRTLAEHNRKIEAVRREARTAR